MASRRFFGYDPYEYYYTAAPYGYPYDPYYPRQPAPARRSRGIFAGAEPSTSFSIPIHGPDSDPEPERKAAQARAEPVAPAMMSAEVAAVRMQAAARGFLVRRSVRAVREVEREAEQVRAKMASEAEALVADPRARLVVGEALMRMLLRLDAVRGSRDYRRRITKRVLALQDAVDARETKAAVGEEAEVDATEATDVEMAEESAVAPELPDALQCGNTPTQVEADEEIAAADDPDDPEGLDAEGEWEMVTEENEHAAPVAATSGDQEPPRKEPAFPLETTASASAASDSDGVDARKLMQMVAALCEQSAEQCAVISALAERVDALERTVRRMAEDAKSRRRQAKKLSTEDK